MRRRDFRPERLHGITVVSSSPQQPSEYGIPSPSGELRWVASGERITVQGYELRHGLIHVGRGSTWTAHFAVDPDLPASPRMAPPLESWNVSPETSYKVLEPERRGRYLEWLARGARSREDRGFGHLYLCGLEERALNLVEGKAGTAGESELEMLRREILRLGELFRDDPVSPVAERCTRLSDFLLLRASPGAVPELPPVADGALFRHRWILCYGLGCYVRDRRPVPAEWALGWLEIAPSISVPAPAVHCPEEFAAAFAETYREHFGKGLVFPRTNLPLRLFYEQSRPARRPPIGLNTEGVVDVISGPAAAAMAQTLRPVVEESIARIAPYTRLIARAPEKAGTVAGCLSLPSGFWPAEARRNLEDLRANFVEPMSPIPTGSFCAAWASRGTTRRRSASGSGPRSSSGSPSVSSRTPGGERASPSWRAP